MTELFVAADGLSTKTKATMEILRRLDKTDEPFGIKFNLDLALDIGLRSAVDMLREFDRPIFADIKMRNGKGTMQRIAEQLVSLKVALFNVYASADEQLSGVLEAVRGSDTKVLGVAELTHYAQPHYLKHYRRSIESETVLLVETALINGCHGVIFPGTMLKRIRKLDIVAGKITAIPGIRPEGYVGKKHAQDITPYEAYSGEATIAICGGPIMKDADPVKALDNILYDLQGRLNL